ncbi:protein FAM172A-like isoform X2 [Arapaima gigas]
MWKHRRASRISWNLRGDFINNLSARHSFSPGCGLYLSRLSFYCSKLLGAEFTLRMECTGPQRNVPSLPGFPYRFNVEGRLCHVDTQEPFVFRYRRGDILETQQQHQVLGRYITQHVHNVLEEQYCLEKVSLPCGESDLQGKNLIFMSPKALEGRGNLMVLIQDRGTVRCGQWSWTVIAREGLERGSQIPYVRWALAEAWEVLLMNPNDSSSPEDHARVVWDLLLSSCAAKNITVVAHGYGGVAFVDLLARRPWEVQRRVCAVAFVDSYHSPWHQPLGPESREWLKANAKKWVLSCKPLNRPVGSLKSDCPQLSAGTQCHDAAPAACMASLCRFFSKAVKAKAPAVPFDIVTRSRSQGRPGRDPPQP